MKQGSTLFLRLTVIVMGAPILALCIFLVPEIASHVAELHPTLPYLKYFVYFVMYTAAIPFYFALYQALKLLRYIDKNQAFSQRSVHALKKIKYAAIAISILYVLGIPIFYIIGEVDDAPGVILLGMMIIFASMVISVFAAVLQRLLQEAIAIKSENDLTV
jgi:hypothetical protein